MVREEFNPLVATSSWISKYFQKRLVVPLENWYDSLVHHMPNKYIYHKVHDAKFLCTTRSQSVTIFQSCSDIPALITIDVALIHGFLSNNGEQYGQTFQDQILHRLCGNNVSEALFEMSENLRINYFELKIECGPRSMAKGLRVHLHLRSSL